MFVLDDWLATIGVSALAGFVYEQVLKDLFKESLEEYVKDFFKDRIKDLTCLAQPEPLQIAVGKAIKEFLWMVQQELEDMQGSNLNDYTKDFKKFLKNPDVKSVLADAFDIESPIVEGSKLNFLWTELNLSPLPSDFDWDLVAKRYLRKVKNIVLEDEGLRDILQVQLTERIQEDTRQIRINTGTIVDTLGDMEYGISALVGVLPNFDLRRYQESISERYGILKLSILDTTFEQYPMRLWNIFIPQDVKEALPPSRHEIPKDVQQQLQEGEIKPIQSVTELLNDKDIKYAVILGDPGSGKSTLLQYVALNWAENPLFNTLIPILIELREYTRDRNCPKNFLKFLQEGTNTPCPLDERQLDELFQKGEAIVMFDGLDEVIEPKERKAVIQEIINFTNQYKNVRVLITSRIIGYNPDYLRDAEFRHFTLQDLDDEHIEQFIKKWHDLTFTPHDPDKKRIENRLQRAIDESRAIHDLAGNPLLLTMMAILNRKQELPRDRAELYEQASRVLLYQWDIESKQLSLPADAIGRPEKQEMLRRVAYAMQAGEKGLAGNIISQRELTKIFTDYLKSQDFTNPRENAKEIIKQLRERNFILCFLGGDYYVFVHRTFLEYFCAWAFVWKFKEDQTLTIEELKTEVFGKHWQDESWHEVLRLIVGMVTEKFAAQLIDYLIEQSQTENDKSKILFLAADCLTEVRNRSLVTDTGKRLLVVLQEMVNLKEIEAFLKEIENLKLDEEDLEPLGEVFAVIANTYPGNTEAFKWLKYHAESNPSQLLRIKAIQAIPQGWKDDPILDWLKALAKSEANTKVRQAAVAEVAKGWRQKPDTLVWLKQLADSDGNPDILTAAIEAVAKGWKTESDTLPWLKNLAQTEAGEVRYAAVRGLIICGKGRIAEHKKYEEVLKLYEEVKTWLQEEDEKAKKELASAFRSFVDQFNPLTKPLDNKQSRLMTYSALSQAAELDFPNPKSNPTAAQRLLWAYRDVDLFEEAIAVGRQLVDAHPQNAMYLNRLATVYYSQGNYGEAIKTCQRALDIFSEKKGDIWLPFTYNDIGDSYHHQGKYDEAIAASQKVIELSSKDDQNSANFPQLYQPYCHLCYLYCDLGKYEEAIAAGKQAIKLFPKAQPFKNSNRSDYNNLGATYIEIGDYDSATYYLNLAIKHNPEDYIARQWLYWIDIKRGELTQAERELKRLIDKYWKPSGYHFALGLVYALQGRTEEAKQQWQKALENSYNRSLTEKIRYALRRTVVGEIEAGLTQIQDILTQFKPPAALLCREVLSKAEVFSRCPVQPAGLDQFVAIVEGYIAGN